MKKSIWVMMLVLFFASAALVSAEGMKEGMMGNKGMMGQGTMDGKMMDMHSMMKGMPEMKVIATSDGGVVVVNGGTLTKYDRNLNLIKQVELKGCKTCVYKKEGAKKGGCPMMGKGMMDDMKESPHGDDVPAKVDAHSIQHP